MSVGANRSPIRLLEIANLAMAYPGELLIDPSTGNFTYKTASGTVTHNKPGKLTVKQGEDTLVNAADMSQDISFTIPEYQTVTWDDIAPEHIAASMINGLTANRVAVANGSGVLTASTIDATHLGYLSDVTSNIQAQLNSKAASNHTHSNYLPTAGGTISGAIKPNANNTIALGTSSARFSNIYSTTFTGALSGNATTATTLATARTITIGSAGKSFNGSANISFTLTEIGAAAATHTHNNYLPIAGGTISGNLLASASTVNIGSSSIPFGSVYANTFIGDLSGNATSATTATSATRATSATTATRLATTRGITIGNATKNFDGSAAISFTLTEIGAAATGHTHSYLPLSGGTLTGNLLASADTVNIGSVSVPFNNVYANTFTGNLSGNATSATTATRLATSRNITIGSSTKGFNGSANISFSLTEIGAAATSHTHSNYLPTAGGTISGAIKPNANNTIDLGTSSLKYRTVYATTFNGALSGNATTATTLATARTLTIGNTGKSFNGSANVSWTLAEIGAAATNHTHPQYMPNAVSSIELNQNGSLEGYGGFIDFHHSTNTAADYTSRIIESNAGTIAVNDVQCTIGGNLHVPGTATGIQRVYSGTLTTSWSGSAAPYTQAVTISGILATDRPIVDYTNSGTYATDQAREEGWLNIYRAVTAANRITFYAHEKPTVSIPFTALVTR